MAQGLGKFVLVSCSEKKREQQALDKEIRECPGFSLIEREDKGPREVWRGKLNSINFNLNKRKEDFLEIINSYNQFKKEKAGDYSIKYLKHLSDLLYKTKNIDYVTERKILVKSTSRFNRNNNKHKGKDINIQPNMTSNSNPNEHSIDNNINGFPHKKPTLVYTPKTQRRAIKVKTRVSIKGSLFALKTKPKPKLNKPDMSNYTRNRYRGCINVNQTSISNRDNETNDGEKDTEKEIRLLEPDIEYEKDEFNYKQLLYAQIRNKWKSFYAFNKPNDVSAKVLHSKSFGLRPKNIDKLLQFSSNRYPAKEHFFKILNIRKYNNSNGNGNTQASPLSTAYSSFPHYSKTYLTTNGY